MAQSERQYEISLCALDDETRFWIAQEVGDTKYKHDAGNLFRKGKEAIGRVPTTLITDGLVSYHEAY
jgi:putative transposase